MAAKPKPADPVQDEPTAPRPTDAAGHTLDEHGLPLSGPARLAALDGKPDPALADREPPIEPEPAADTPAPPAQD